MFPHTVAPYLGETLYTCTTLACSHATIPDPIRMKGSNMATDPNGEGGADKEVSICQLHKGKMVSHQIFIPKDTGFCDHNHSHGAGTFPCAWTQHVSGSTNIQEILYPRATFERPSSSLFLSFSVCLLPGTPQLGKKTLVLCSTGILGFRILYTRFGDQQE